MENDQNNIRLKRLPSIPQIWNAVASKETNYDKYPEKSWMRTAVKPKWNPKKKKWVGSSTAYGPVQVTRTKMADSITRFPALKQFQTYYDDVMKDQFDGFIEHGMNAGKPGYDRRFDYGGRGNELNKGQRAAYRTVTERMMQQDFDNIAKEGITDPQEVVNEFIKRWRGVAADKDPKYYSGVNNYLYNNYKDLYQDPATENTKEPTYRPVTNTSNRNLAMNPASSFKSF